MMKTFIKENGKEYLVQTDGVIVAWYFNTRLHREDGPAKIWISGKYKGHLEWYWHGKCHREDGPAVLRINGLGPYWYLYDKNLSKEAFLRRLNKMGKVVYINGIPHLRDGRKIHGL